MGHTKSHRPASGFCEIAADKERQIGLARMPIDRFVARVAGAAGGLVRTPLLALEGAALILNANLNGELRVRLLDERSVPIPRFDFSENATIRGDSAGHAVTWKSAPWLPRQPMRTGFTMRDARLDGFTLTANIAP